MARQDPTAEREVTCIRTQPRQDRHKAITHLGGKGWLMTRWQVTASIDSGGGVYYLLVGGRRADIQVVAGNGEPYLRSVVDNEWTDDLLALPECRGSIDTRSR
jgi:hypothetical protein